MEAIGQPSDLSDLELADRLSEVSGVKVPAAVEALRTARVMHDIVCDQEEMMGQVRDFLGL